MPRYDLTDLQVFATLARTGSLTAAARTLPYTASALSLRLRKLEEALGTALFTREARGLALTPAGDMLLAQAQNVLRAAAQLETAMSGFNRAERTTLRIASNSTGLQSVIAPAAGPFLAGRSVRLVFLERRTRACLDALRDGSADLAFGLETRFREEADLEVLHVVADRHVVVLPKTHPLASRPSVKFSETLAYPYVSAPRSTPIGAAMAERAEALGIDYAPVAEMPSFALTLELVLQGAGLAIMPKAALRSRADALERLSVVDLVDEWADRPLAFAHLKNRPLTAAAHAFVRACATEWADFG